MSGVSTLPILHKPNHERVYHGQMQGFYSAPDLGGGLPNWSSPNFHFTDEGPEALEREILPILMAY